MYITLDIIRSSIQDTEYYKKNIIKLYFFYCISYWKSIYELASKSIKTESLNPLLLEFQWRCVRSWATCIIKWW